jgi:hypothetical protein
MEYTDQKHVDVEMTQSHTSNVIGEVAPALKHADISDGDEALKALANAGERITLDAKTEKALLRKIDMYLMPVCTDFTVLVPPEGLHPRNSSLGLFVRILTD